MEEEIWLPVNIPDYQEFAELYEVSDLGRVRSRNHWAVSPTGHPALKPGRIRNLKTTPKGYLALNLKLRGRSRTFFVHRLVVYAFLPPPTGDQNQVNHVDGNKQNNRVTNLEWCSGKHNMQHALANKLIKPRCGDENKATKISNANVARIFEMRAAGFTQKYIAAELGVASCTISNILARRNRADITANIPIRDSYLPESIELRQNRKTQGR